MSFLNLIADIDPSPREVTEKQDRTIRENAEMERQTTEDVKEFLAEQAAGKAHSLTETSGTVGKLNRNEVCDCSSRTKSSRGPFGGGGGGSSLTGGPSFTCLKAFVARLIIACRFTLPATATTMFPAT